VNRWELDVDEEPEPPTSAPPWATTLAALLEGLMWVLLGVAAVFLVRWLYLHPGLRLANRPHRPQVASVVIHGETLRAEALDPKAPQNAWQLWQVGQQRQALGLLYRASLRVLLAGGVTLGEAATEAECLHRAGGQLPQEAHAYLQRLTQGWQSLAYAHRPPTQDEMAQLCREWSRVLWSLLEPQESQEPLA